MLVMRCVNCKKNYVRFSLYQDMSEKNLCPDCFQIESKEEMLSAKCIRCPLCGEVDKEDLCLMEEGLCEIVCRSCSFLYEVDTRITVKFKSPKRIEMHHGGSSPCIETWTPLEEAGHRFLCIACQRWCCACFGAADETDRQMDDGEGICCDCHVAMREGRTILWVR